MSGKPSEAGVTEFLAVLKEMGDAQSNRRRLMGEIRDRQSELEKQTEIYEKTRRVIFDLMSRMDIQSNGNFGYEDRMSWFLTEMQHQISATRQEETT